MLIFSDYARFRLSAVLAIVMMTTAFQILDKTQYMVEMDKALDDKILNGYAFRNVTMKNFVECFFACAEDCTCMAFQMCSDGTECQLLSSNKFQSPSAMVSFSGCSYYDMVPTKLQQDALSSSASCGVGCMCRANPCQHGGSCEPIVPKDYKTPRYKCNCLPGYSGHLCQNEVKSCRGYISGSRVSDIYTVFDDHMNLFNVYCNFDMNSTMTWTLIQSYQWQNKDNFDKGYSDDYSVHENAPRWDAYRLSNSRMKSIQADSSKWRMTCRYDTDGVVYRDYLQASNKEVDILTYDNDGCTLVERIDIRGHNCYQCIAHLAQRKHYAMHSDSYFAKTHGCQLRPTGSYYCGGDGEDNFGRYGCYNQDHRCSSNKTATTQTWFGGD